jgi:hypothetical protein
MLLETLPDSTNNVHVCYMGLFGHLPTNQELNELATFQQVPIVERIALWDA